MMPRLVFAIVAVANLASACALDLEPEELASSREHDLLSASPEFPNASGVNATFSTQGRIDVSSNNPFFR